MVFLTGCGMNGGMEKMFFIKKYEKMYEYPLIDFLQQCLPESNRKLDLDGRHRFYQDIENYFEAFWCMFYDEKIIGTVAVKTLENNMCELKSLYLFERYHGRGLGRRLLTQAIDFARGNRYEKMYLDSLSSSEKALGLYRKVGFIETERYNQNEFADIFMVLDLKL